MSRNPKRRVERDERPKGRRDLHRLQDQQPHPPAEPIPASPPPKGTDPGEERRDRLTAAFLGVILILFVFHALYLGRVLNDDAFISLRYSWNLAHGAGLVYNPGERVEGFSNPLHVLLFSLLLSLAGWTLPSALAVGKGMGILAGLAAIGAAWGLGREVLADHPLWGRDARRLALLPALLTAGSTVLAAGAMTLLETDVLAALLTLGLWAQLAERRSGRWRGSALFLALAALSRPEGVLLAGMAALGGLWIGRREGIGDAAGGVARRLSVAGGSKRNPLRLPLISLAAIIAASAAWTCFRFAYFDGELLPNTYFAKAGGFWGETWWQYVLGYFRSYGLFLVPAVAAAVALVLRGGRRALLLLPAGAMVSVHLASFAFTGADWMPGYRLLAPSLPALAVIETAGLLEILALAARHHPRPALRAWTVYLAAGWIVAAQLQAWEPRRDLRKHLAVREAGYRKGHVALAEWLRDSRTVRAGDTASLMDIGLVGFLNPGLRIIDISGLTDRTIAKAPGGFLQKGYDPAYILDQQPAAVILTLYGPRSLSDPLAVGDLEPGTKADRRLFQHPRFREEYAFDRLFRHDHPDIAYALAVYLRRGASPERR